MPRASWSPSAVTMRFAQAHSGAAVAQLAIQIGISETPNVFIDLIRPPCRRGRLLQSARVRFRPALLLRGPHGEPDDGKKSQEHTADHGIGHDAGVLGLRLTPTFGSFFAVPMFMPRKLMTLRMALTTLSSVSFAVMAAIIANAPMT